MSHAATRTRRAAYDDDSRSTRERLLETAGEVFAEKGFDRSTGKEICARASVNVAAINYYFGSFEHLYGAVLEEAQKRFITFDDIVAVVARQKDAKGKLRALVGLAAQRLTAPVSKSWAFRVIAREMPAPSKTFMALREREIPPRAILMKQLVSEIVGLPAEHPAVARAALSIIAPFAMLSIADRGFLERAFPSLPLDETGATALADHFYHYAMAGLADVKKRAGKKR
jgi:AcrR family transcriptional regulator